jgi:hypothetical protein
VSRARPWVRRRPAGEDGAVFAALVALTAGVCVALFLWDAVTATALLAPLLLAVVLLSPRRLPAFVLTLLVLLLVETVVEYRDGDLPARRWVAVVLLLLTAAFTLYATASRAKLGVTGVRGDAILLDASERMGAQGRIPDLPPTWYADVAARASGGTSFAGDFLVAHRSDDGRHLAVVLVDVSGKGVDAGARAMLLSGAFSGLLGAVPRAEFLAAANAFLLRQDWPEGFATAIHLWVDLVDGRFELRSAGHPPATQYRASAGRWQVHSPEGPLLGVVRDPAYDVVAGVLGPGDAVLLYTDGLVERSRLDIGQGIDRLLGLGERIVQRGFEGSAADIVGRLASTGDDCALVVVHRKS